jgi:hypothetical protein
MGKSWVRKTGSCLLALGFAAGTAEARGLSNCATDAEVTAMQATAVQQELMDAALTCGADAENNYNAFQTSFGPELRKSDKALLRMFYRLDGFSKGDAAYNRFKTDLAAKAELHRVHGVADFCTTARLVSAAALGPQKPSLADFVSGVSVSADMQGPFDSCKIQVAVTLQGAMAAPYVVPEPNPLRVAALAPKPEALAPVDTAPAPVTAPAPAVPVPQPPAKEDDSKKSSGGWLSGLMN